MAAVPRISAQLAAKLAALLFAASVQCAAAPFAVQLGDARIGLDAPPGFADTGFTGSPRLQELAETLTSASNRILLFALTDADLRRFMQGDQLEARRYMVVVTPKGMERERITSAAFNNFVLDSLRALGETIPPGTEHRKYLDAAPGRMQLLGELRRDPDVVSVLQGVRVPPTGRTNEPAYYGLSTTTLLLLRGKALNLSVYSGYDSPADLEWIRGVTVRWVEDLQRLNSR